jgi:hypothetical protein
MVDAPTAGVLTAFTAYHHPIVQGWALPPAR